MTGHPDDQAYATWRADPFVNLHNLQINGAVTGGPFTVGHYASLYVNLQVIAGQADVFIDHYADAGATELVDRYHWTPTDTTALRVMVPITTQYVKTIVESLGGAPATVTFVVLPTNVGSQGIDYPVTQNSIITGNVNYLANADTSYQLPFIQGGPAMVFFDPGDASGKLDFLLHVQNPDDTIGNRIYHKSGIVTAFNDTVVLPDRPVSMRVHNTDAAAAHTAFASLIAGGAT